MEGRKWEEMNVDCLVNVFGRVGMESLLLDVPFVCKSWYKATLSPLCWRRLDFPLTLFEDEYLDTLTPRLKDEYESTHRVFSITAFINSIVKRSNRSATYLALPVSCTEEALLYVADECPDLRILLLPYELYLDYMIPNLISKWKNLEFLVLGSSIQMIKEILAEISVHCKNFVGFGVIAYSIPNNEASAIVNLLPNLKYLSLTHADIQREDLVMIFKGCKELFYLDVNDCCGFEEADEEILKLCFSFHDIQE